MIPLPIVQFISISVPVLRSPGSIRRSARLTPVRLDGGSPKASQLAVAFLSPSERGERMKHIYKVTFFFQTLHRLKFFISIFLFFEYSFNLLHA